MVRGAGCKGQRGFSLLEVLAAIVIFGIGASVLFGWVAQTATRLKTYDTDQRLLFGQLAALEFARTLNPMTQPAGETVVGDSTVTWKAVPVGEESPVLTASGALGWYAVRLYQVDLVVQQPQAHWNQALYLVGWRQTQRQTNNLPFGP